MIRKPLQAACTSKVAGTDDVLIRILKSYVTLSEAEHVGASYQFPCVLLHCGPTQPVLSLAMLWARPDHERAADHYGDTAATLTVGGLEFSFLALSVEARL